MSKMPTNSSLPFEDQMPVFKDVAELAKLCALDRDQYLLYMDAVDRYRASVAVYNEQYEKGKLKERYNNAKALKENDVPVAIISVSLGLSVEEVEKL